VLAEARRLSNGSVKVFASAPAPLTGVYELFGPFNSMPYGELEKKVHARAEKTGETLMEAAQAVRLQLFSSCPLLQLFHIVTHLSE
jgi:hypothetical protein